MSDTGFGSVTVLAAGADWNDVIVNFFYDWKVWASILSVVVLCTAGIFMLARARMVGVLLIIAGLFFGGFFATIERWVDVTSNTTEQWRQPAPNSNPFNRG